MVTTFMTCPHCKKVIVEDSVYCSYCGRKVTPNDLPISNVDSLENRLRNMPPSGLSTLSKSRVVKPKPAKSIADRIKRKGEYGEPDDEDDAKDRIAIAIASRRGQKEFRQKLIDRYGATCLITGPNTEAILEAAHIRAYKDGGTFDISNGLLLRADIHTLFDLGLIAINSETLKVEIHKSLWLTSYRELADRHLLVQEDYPKIPDMTALNEHYVQSQVRVEAH